MDTAITVAIISASAAGVVLPAISYYFTKSKERAADWERYKFEMYKELVFSLSGIVGTDTTPEGNRRFAAACNAILLIAPTPALNALYAFQDEIRVSNLDRSVERHDALLSRLIWEIRRDLRIPGTPEASEFAARLWCSGAAPPQSKQH
jgi:hypothetical protein